jgi:hypothetical protein
MVQEYPRPMIDNNFKCSDTTLKLDHILSHTPHLRTYVATC